jgi:acid-activated urea channel
MTTGIGLLYVGAVLLLNGVSMVQKFEDTRAIAVMNFFTGGLYVVICAVNLAHAVFSGADISAYYGVGTSMLFGFTYLFVGMTNWHGLDARPQSWYCFFVAVTTVPCSLFSFQSGDWRFGIIWLVWGYLWAIYWLTGAFAKLKAPSWLVPYSTIVVALATCWVPGYLLLADLW